MSNGVDKGRRARLQADWWWWRAGVGTQSVQGVSPSFYLIIFYDKVEK